jgi:signal transduction histidine kinase
MVGWAVWVTLSPATAAERALRLPPGVDPAPLGLPLDASLSARITSVLLALAVAGFLVSAALVVVRYRTGDEEARAGLRWLLWGVVLVVFAVVLGLLVGSPRLSDLTLFLLVVVPSAAATVGLVSPRLTSIETLLSATVVHGTLAVLIVGLDVAALAAATRVLGDSLEQRRVVAGLLLVSTLVYNPLRRRLQLAVRRVAVGDRHDPYGVVSALATSLESADEGSQQLATVADAVAAAFRVPYVSVEVDRTGGERLVATHGTRPDAVRTLPISYRDTEVGRLVLPAHGLRSRLSPRDERLLADLVRQAAAAARSTRLAEDLQDSRERLVVAREEERRRIRRDLHDGLGPALSGVVFRLETAQLLVDADPPRARAQIEVTSEQVRDIVTDVRRLVHDLRPPALDDLGLVGAVEQQARALRESGLDLTVEAGDDLAALPAAVEVAAYRIVAEATTNVVRHADATHCVVRLRVEGPALVVEVADDGRGVPTGTQAGVGLLSVRERVDELGGSAEVSCPDDGGTVVRATLPLRGSR